VRANKFKSVKLLFLQGDVMIVMSEPYVANLQRNIGIAKLIRYPALFAAGIGGILSGNPAVITLALITAYGVPTTYVELKQGKLIEHYQKKPQGTK
jgi:hypothetical protein